MSYSMHIVNSVGIPSTSTLTLIQVSHWENVQSGNRPANCHPCHSAQGVPPERSHPPAGIQQKFVTNVVVKRIFANIKRWKSCLYPHPSSMFEEPGDVNASSCLPGIEELFHKLRSKADGLPRGTI